MSDPAATVSHVLHELRISDLGVIDDAVLEPHAGFTVVTGETGAGKTMIVTALGLVTGGRGDAARVRAGSDRAVVEARTRDRSCRDARRHHRRGRGPAGRGRTPSSQFDPSARTADPGPTSVADPCRWPRCPSSPTHRSRCTASRRRSRCCVPRSSGPSSINSPDWMTNYGSTAHSVPNGSSWPPTWPTVGPGHGNEPNVNSSCGWD